MIGRPLDAAIPALQELDLARIQHELDLALDDDAVVERDGAVHGADVVGLHVDGPDDGARVDGDARAGLEVLAVRLEVGAVDLGRERGRAVLQAEDGGFGRDGGQGQFGGKSVRHDGFALGVVVCDVPVQLAQAGVGEVGLGRHIVWLSALKDCREVISARIVDGGCNCLIRDLARVSKR